MPAASALLPPLADAPPRTALVIGGGVIGQAIAYRLQRQGIATTLIDPEQSPRGASWGNAGHIAVEQIEPLASRAILRALPRRLFQRGGPVSLPRSEARAWLPFARRFVAASSPRRFGAGKRALTTLLGEAMPAWRRLLGDLDAADLLRRDGHFIVWENGAHGAAHRWERADLGAAHGRDATAEELERLRALVRRPLTHAVKIEGSGQIADLSALAAALSRGFAAAHGVRLIGRVAQLRVERGRASVMLDSGTWFDPDAVVIAAGVRSRALLEPIGHRVPMIAERGYHLQAPAEGWPADMPPIVFEDRSIIVTRFHDRLRVAGFVEFARPDSPPDPRKWMRLRGHVAALGLPIALAGEEWIGSRPTLPDYLPALGRSAGARNLYYAFGHQHLGLTLAAITGEAIAAIVARRTPPIDLTPFDLARFR